MSNLDKPRKNPAKCPPRRRTKPNTGQEFIPGGLSRRQREILHHLHEDFARLFATSLAVRFQRDVFATVLSIEPMGAKDFFHPIPQASFMTGFVSRKCEGEALVAFSANDIHRLLAQKTNVSRLAPRKRSGGSWKQ